MIHFVGIIFNRLFYISCVIISCVIVFVCIRMRLHFTGTIHGRLVSIPTVVTTVTSLEIIFERVVMMVVVLIVGLFWCC